MKTVIEPPLGEAAISVFEWAAKAAVALGSVKVGLSGIYKPFMEWKKEHNARTIREVLEPELKQLRSIIDDESGCAGKMSDVLTQMRAIFTDLDMFVDIAADNRERLDETNALLDAVGFNAERRVDTEQRDKITQTMAELTERRRRRRRALIVLSNNPEVQGD